MDEEKARNSLFRELTENSVNLEGWLDGDGRLKWVNRTVERLIGVKAEECLRTEDFLVSLIHPDFRQEFSDALNQALSDQLSVQDREFAVRTADSRVSHLSFSWQPFIDSQDRYQGLRFCARDVSRRRLTEQALKKAEHRYRTLYNRTPMMLHSIDGQGRLISVSDAWLEKLGYEREEVLGRKSVEFMTPQSRKFAEQTVIPGYLKTGVVTDVPYQMQTRDGRVVEVLLSAVAEMDEAGRLVRSLTILKDVTGQREAERELRRTERRFEEVFNYSPVATIEFDLSKLKERLDRLKSQGVENYDAWAAENPTFFNDCAADLVMVDLNRAAVELFGVQDRAGVIEDFTTEIGSNAWQAYRRIIIALVQGRTSGSLEAELEVEEGRPTMNLFSWALVEGHENTWDRYILTVTDNTALNRAEALVRETRANFQSLFEDSPIALLQENFSALPPFFERLRRETGRDDLEEYFLDNPQALTKAASLMQIEKVNQAALETFGAGSEEQLVGMLDKLIDPLASATLTRELAALARGETRFSTEAGYTTLTGNQLWAKLNLAVPPGHEQSLDRIYISLVDITDLKSAQEALLTSEADLRALFEDSPISLWQQDCSEVVPYFSALRKNGITDFKAHFTDNPESALEAASLLKVVKINPPTLELYLAESEEELLGRGMERILDLETLPTLAGQLDALARGKQTFRDVVANTTLDGRRIWLNLQMTIPPEYSQNLERVYLAMVDITIQKNAWQEREQALEELQRALNEVKTLTGFLPICANCKKIRDDSGYWHRVEKYVQDHSSAVFSHGICPECRKELYPELEKDKVQDPESLA